MENNAYFKFNESKNLKSKYIPKIPVSAEREYYRLVDDYIKTILKKEIESNLASLKIAYKVNRNEKVRLDEETDFILAITKIFNNILNGIIKKTAKFGLRRKLENLANINRKLTIKEWKKCCKATLGIDIREDYYLGNFYKEQLEEWVENNVNLIVTVPSDCLDKMKSIVYECYTKGRTTTQMTRLIVNAYGMSKRHARLIARDQTAKLNGAIQKAQQQDAGIEEYIWSTSDDSRVRHSHRILNGKTFSWNEPPETDNGRHCHPAEDYQCRCVARPVFNNEISLPVDANEKETN